MHELTVSFSPTSPPKSIRIRNEILQKVLLKHLSDVRERWGLVLGSEFVSQFHSRDDAKLTADEVLYLITTLKRELADAAALPRIIDYFDNESGFRSLKLLLSDRCLIAVIKVPISGETADLLTAYVPTEAGVFSESDSPTYSDKKAFKRVRKQFVMKYCPLEGSPLRLPDAPWSRDVEKPWGLRVNRRIQGFIDPMHWGFSSNSPGAAFTG